MFRAVQSIDRIAPTLRPTERPVGFQRWRHLLFLHWTVPVDVMRAAVPTGVELDLWEGQAWLGVVPFTMVDVAPAWAPSVPGISNFHELNVRTYVVKDGVPGVWFFSLDAAKTVAVAAARVGWGLPYHRAAMRLEIDGEPWRVSRALSPARAIDYTSKRLWPSGPAELATRYDVGLEIGSATPGTFEHFLAERYVLFTARSGVRAGRVHHRAYPLFQARVSALRESMSTAVGLPTYTSAPHALYSPGVDVDVFPLRHV